MAHDGPSEALRTGRLYAVLAELQKQAVGEHHSLGLPGTLRALLRAPSKVLNPHLWQVGAYLLAARNRGKGESATVLFRSIPDVLPLGQELPHALTPQERERFHEGLTAQRAEIAKALQEL
ncbi:hypothetical protein [Streptomyces sp. SID8358]|uniref:hypothetical protein n=1 Tax=unclassified Streptomyces TaxID=2593676 RepID=UPI000DAC44CB|nr:hypothetical protein [Streptomyces sp. SID8358]MYU36489.1 hypothetical protein [Streptomyces sp. SID8358]